MKGNHGNGGRSCAVADAAPFLIAVCSHVSPGGGGGGGGGRGDWTTPGGRGDALGGGEIVLGSIQPVQDTRGGFVTKGKEHLGEAGGCAKRRRCCAGWRRPHRSLSPFVAMLAMVADEASHWAAAKSCLDRATLSKTQEGAFSQEGWAGQGDGRCANRKTLCRG